MIKITIAQDGSGDFTNINEAISSIQDITEHINFYIKSGIYNEKVLIEKSHVTFIGANAKDTIITFNDYALMKMPTGEKRGTFRTSTFFIDADHFTAKDITFENSAGDGKTYGQALALYADGDNITFENCCFKGRQDTLFTAPLPPKEFEKNGFVGRKQFAPRRHGKHLYKNCYIEGDVDFIFGSATAYFDKCEIFSCYNGSDSCNGYITAASTPKDIQYGYIFNECRFTSNCPAKTVYLGRPWREYAKTVLINCELGAHIKEKGWHDWDKIESHSTIFYAEYHSFGAGAHPTKRASFSKQLTEEEAKVYSMEKVFNQQTTTLK